MTDIEQIIWALTYAAATNAQCGEPVIKANDAVIYYQKAERFFDDSHPTPPPPEEYDDQDVPF